jgi:hypothetical protein
MADESSKMIRRVSGFRTQRNMGFVPEVWCALLSPSTASSTVKFLQLVVIILLPLGTPHAVSAHPCYGMTLCPS